MRNNLLNQNQQNYFYKSISFFYPFLLSYVFSIPIYDLHYLNLSYLQIIRYDSIFILVGWNYLIDYYLFISIYYFLFLIVITSWVIVVIELDHYLISIIEPINFPSSILLYPHDQLAVYYQK